MLTLWKAPGTTPVPFTDQPGKNMQSWWQQAKSPPPPPLLLVSGKRGVYLNPRHHSLSSVHWGRSGGEWNPMVACLGSGTLSITVWDISPHLLPELLFIFCGSHCLVGTFIITYPLWHTPTSTFMFVGHLKKKAEAIWEKVYNFICSVKDTNFC